jgi:hypothetical protein
MDVSHLIRGYLNGNENSVGRDKTLKPTTVHDSRERNLSILFRGPFARLFDEAIQILIGGSDYFCGFKMLQRLLIAALAGREDAEVYMRLGVASVEIDSRAKFLRCLIAAASRGFEPAERCVIG